MSLVVACSIIFATSSLASVNSHLDPFPSISIAPGQSFTYRIQASFSGEPPSFRMMNAPDGATLINNGDGSAEFIWQPNELLANETVVLIQVLSGDQLPTTQRMVLRRDDSMATNKNDTLVQSTEPEAKPLSAPVAKPLARPIAESLEVLPTIDRQNLLVGQNYELFIRHTDVPGVETKLFADNLPEGATLSEAFSGGSLFRWIPTAGQLGDHHVNMIVGGVNSPVNQPIREIIFSVSDSVMAGGPSKPALKENVVAASAMVDSSSNNTSELNNSITVLAASRPAADELPILDESSVESAVEPAIGDIGVSNASPFIEPISVAVVSAGQVIRFKVVPRMPDQSPALLHVDRLPSGASFDDNEDGTRTFYWPTTRTDEGEHIFRFTAIHPTDVEQRTSTDALIIVGDPSAEGSQPAE